MTVTEHYPIISTAKAFENMINSTEEEVDDYWDSLDLWEWDLADNIWKYIPPFLIIFGTIGNLLSIIVMSQKSMKDSVTSLLFRILAFIDTLVLYTGLLRYWLIGAFQIDVRLMSMFACKFHTFLVYVTADLSGWILVCITLERCIAVLMPYRYNNICTRTKALILLLIVTILLAGINSYLLFSIEFSFDTVNHYYQCIVTNKFNTFHGNIWPWIDYCLYSLLPFFLILFGNIALLVGISKTRVKREHASNSSSSSRSMSSMTAILITVSFSFWICTSPVSIYLIMQSTMLENITWKAYSKMTLFWASATIIANVNNAINFGLYCVSGSRFRRELKHIFCQCFTVSGTSHERSDNSVTKY